MFLTFPVGFHFEINTMVSGQNIQIFYTEKPLFSLPAWLFIAKTYGIFVSYWSLGFFPFIPFLILFLYPSVFPCPSPAMIPSFPCLWFFPKRYHYNTCKIPGGSSLHPVRSPVPPRQCSLPSSASLWAPAAGKEEFFESSGSPYLTIPSNHH